MPNLTPKDLLLLRDILIEKLTNLQNYHQTEDEPYIKKLETILEKLNA